MTFPLICRSQQWFGSCLQSKKMCASAPRPQTCSVLLILALTKAMVRFSSEVGSMKNNPLPGKTVGTGKHWLQLLKQQASEWRYKTRLSSPARGILKSIDTHFRRSWSMVLLKSYFVKSFLCTKAFSVQKLSLVLSISEKKNSAKLWCVVVMF